MSADVTSNPVAAFFSACDLALTVVGSAPVAERWDADSALEGLTVGALAAHLYAAIRRLETALAQPEPEAPLVIAGITDFYGPNRIDDRGQLDDVFHVAVRTEAAERARKGAGALVVAVLRAFSRRERADPEVLRVL